MRLNDYPDTCVYGPCDNLCKPVLGTRMKVKFWLLNVDNLLLFGGEKRDQDWEGLRNTKSNIGNVDAIHY